MSTIAQMKSALAGGGARPNMFIMNITIPQTDIFETTEQISLNGSQSFLCKSTSIPQENIGVIEIPFMGKTLKITGDRTIENWTATFINDEDFNIHRIMSKWSNAVFSNMNQIGMRSPSSYMGIAEVTQLARADMQNRLTSNLEQINAAALHSNENAAQWVADTDRKIIKWKMNDIWPTSVSEISLASDSNDTLEEFTVDFAVQSFSVETLDTSATLTRPDQA